MPGRPPSGFRILRHLGAQVDDRAFDRREFGHEAVVEEGLGDVATFGEVGVHPGVDRGAEDAAVDARGRRRAEFAPGRRLRIGRGVDVAVDLGPGPERVQVVGEDVGVVGVGAGADGLFDLGAELRREVGVGGPVEPGLPAEEIECPGLAEWCRRWRSSGFSKGAQAGDQAKLVVDEGDRLGEGEDSGGAESRVLEKLQMSAAGCRRVAGDADRPGRSPRQAWCLLRPGVSTFFARAIRARSGRRSPGEPRVPIDHVVAAGVRGDANGDQGAVDERELRRRSVGRLEDREVVVLEARPRAPASAPGARRSVQSDRHVQMIDRRRRSSTAELYSCASFIACTFVGADLRVRLTESPAAD